MKLDSNKLLKTPQYKLRLFGKKIITFIYFQASSENSSLSLSHSIIPHANSLNKWVFYIHSLYCLTIISHICSYLSISDVYLFLTN